jgi:ATP-binding cassette subfamily C (CFTR/MRP) protein 1
MRVIKTIALYNAFSYFIWSLAPFIIAMVSFITFVMLGGQLTAQKAFVSLALFNLLRLPMTFCKYMISIPDLRISLNLFLYSPNADEFLDAGNCSRQEN